MYIGIILGLYWDDGKENGNYRVQALDRGFEVEVFVGSRFLAFGLSRW